MMTQFMHGTRASPSMLGRSRDWTDTAAERCFINWLINGVATSRRVASTETWTALLHHQLTMDFSSFSIAEKSNSFQINVQQQGQQYRKLQVLCIFLSFKEHFAMLTSCKRVTVTRNRELRVQF